MQPNARQHCIAATAARAGSGQPPPELQPAARRPGFRAGSWPGAATAQGPIVGRCGGRWGWRAWRGRSRAA